MTRGLRIAAAAAALATAGTLSACSTVKAPTVPTTPVTTKGAKSTAPPVGSVGKQSVTVAGTTFTGKPTGYTWHVTWNGQPAVAITLMSVRVMKSAKAKYGYFGVFHFHFHFHFHFVGLAGAPSDPEYLIAPSDFGVMLSDGYHITLGGQDNNGQPNADIFGGFAITPQGSGGQTDFMGDVIVDMPVAHGVLLYNQGSSISMTQLSNGAYSYTLAPEGVIASWSF